MRVVKSCLTAIRQTFDLSTAEMETLKTEHNTFRMHPQCLLTQSKKISNDQELIQSDPISCPQNQKENN